jgi:hypothetical protein
MPRSSNASASSRLVAFDFHRAGDNWAVRWVGDRCYHWWGCVDRLWHLARCGDLASRHGDDGLDGKTDFAASACRGDAQSEREVSVRCLRGGVEVDTCTRSRSAAAAALSGGHDRRRSTLRLSFHRSVDKPGVNHIDVVCTVWTAVRRYRPSISVNAIWWR